MKSITVLAMAVVAAFCVCSCNSVPTYKGEEVELKVYPYASKDVKPIMIATYTPPYAYRPFFQKDIPATEKHKISKKSKKVFIQNLLEVRAERDHGGIWSDEAMRFDLQRMSACGFQGVLLRIRPEDLIDDIRLDRIKQFFRISSQQSPALPVGLLIYSDTHIEMGSGNFAQFLHEADFEKLPSLLFLNKDDDRMLVVFDLETISLNDQSYHEEERFDIRRMKNARDIVDAPDIRQIKAADCGANSGISSEAQFSWPIPRGDGSFLAHALQEAFKDKILVILLHSWNGFKDGSFIVENNADQTLMQTVITRELDALAALPMPDKNTDEQKATEKAD